MRHFLIIFCFIAVGACTSSSKSSSGSAPAGEVKDFLAKVSGDRASDSTDQKLLSEVREILKSVPFFDAFAASGLVYPISTLMQSEQHELEGICPISMDKRDDDTPGHDPIYARIFDTKAQVDCPLNVHMTDYQTTSRPPGVTHIGFQHDDHVTAATTTKELGHFAWSELEYHSKGDEFGTFNDHKLNSKLTSTVSFSIKMKDGTELSFSGTRSKNSHDVSVVRRSGTAYEWTYLILKYGGREIPISVMNENGMALFAYVGSTKTEKYGDIHDVIPGNLDLPVSAK